VAFTCAKSSDTWWLYFEKYKQDSDKQKNINKSRLLIVVLLSAIELSLIALSLSLQSLSLILLVSTLLLVLSNPKVTHNKVPHVCCFSHRKGHEARVAVGASHRVGLPCSGLAVGAHAPMIARRCRYHHSTHRTAVQFRCRVPGHEQVVESKPLVLAQYII